jgi:tetratricopeptide (TPR) repeat protein
MHPREFGRYRILKLLPKGGMGTVYLAIDPETEAQVALKLIELGPDLDRQEIAAAEQRGAMLQEQLCHLDRRVAQIRSYGELEGFFFIEMEYVEGHDLSELLRGGPIGVPFTARIGCDLCEVLNHSHRLTAVIEGQQYRGIVHGDIKPRNIRITPDGEVRVLDFGIAKALSLTRDYTQIQFGSSQYSSPERLLHGEVNVASDLWSVAVVLFESATGRPYFEAETGPRLESLIRNYREIRPMPANLPRPFAAILRKALHPDAAMRYQSAEEFGSDLKAFLGGRATVAESMPEDFDSERTRRTTQVADADRAVDPVDEATRRTSAELGARPGKRAPSKRRGLFPLTRQQRRAVLAGVLGTVLLIGGFIWHEVSVWEQGNTLARELQTEHLTDLNAAWVRYQALNERNHLPLVLYSPRKTILDRLIYSADRTILDFRNSESLSVTEGDWKRAKAVLEKALELDPSDKEIRGKMYLCDGHIIRIGATTSKTMNQARARFEQAHDLIPKSPDPFIGLARLYVYSLHDVEKAEEALKQASKRGYEIGRRGKAQLGDGYRDRAERLMREADKAAGLPEEKDYLERAQSDFERAENLYRDIVPFAGSATSLRRVLEYTEIVDVRLKAIREGA